MLINGFMENASHIKVIKMLIVKTSLSKQKELSMQNLKCEMASSNIKLVLKKTQKQILSFSSGVISRDVRNAELSIQLNSGQFFI